jgi:hypothetical protein
MGDPSVVCQSLGGTAGGDKSCVLSPPDEKAKLKDWEDLLNFRPREVKDALRKRFNGQYDPIYHPIEAGYGALNLDFYAVQITKLPSIAGSELSQEQLVRYIRWNLGAMIDPSIARFTSYDSVDDQVWGSMDSALGAVMHFEIQTGVMGGTDFAGVVAAEYATDHWIFSTLPTPRDDKHPVSGNRKFGCAVLRAGQTLSDVYQKAGVSIDNKNGDALYFYTRGADRCTRAIDYAASATGDAVFAGGHACWLSLQQRVMAWIIKQGGQAIVAGNVSERWDWGAIRAGGLGSLWHDPSQ